MLENFPSDLLALLNSIATGESLVCNVACTRYLFALLPQLHRDMSQRSRTISLHIHECLSRFEAVHTLTLEFDEHEDLHHMSLNPLWYIFKQVQTLTLVGGHFGYQQSKPKQKQSNSSAAVDDLDDLDEEAAFSAKQQQKIQAALIQHLNVKNKRESSTPMPLPDHISHIVLRCQKYGTPPLFSPRMRSLLVICRDITDLREVAHSLEFMATHVHGVNGFRESELHTLCLRLCDLKQEWINDPSLLTLPRFDKMGFSKLQHLEVPYLNYEFGPRTPIQQVTTAFADSFTHHITSRAVCA
jgi:hypothetical protein